MYETGRRSTAVGQCAALYRSDSLMYLSYGQNLYCIIRDYTILLGNIERQDQTFQEVVLNFALLMQSDAWTQMRAAHQNYRIGSVDMTIFLLILKIILKVTAGLFLLSAAISIMLFRIGVCRNTLIPFKKKHKEETPVMKAYREGMEELAASAYEAHSIISYDGLRLSGHYLPAAETPAFILLCMHGYRSNSFKEFGIFKTFYHDVLKADMMFPDERGHGESEGKYICYGVKERFDVLYWIDYINALSQRRYGKILPVYIHGVSMGCATVLMAYGLGYPDNVKGIIADCGFTSPDAIFRSVIKRTFYLPRFPVLKMANLISKAVAGFEFSDASVPDILRRADKYGIPILFIHGGSDHFVPTGMSIQNYEACSAPKKLLIVKGASHASSYYADKVAYEEAVQELIYSQPTS